jgi:hypothetical protein
MFWKGPMGKDASTLCIYGRTNLDRGDLGAVGCVIEGACADQTDDDEKGL